jgi:hypothetical protein
MNQVEFTGSVRDKTHIYHLPYMRKEKRSVEIVCMTLMRGAPYEVPIQVCDKQ